MDTDPVWCLWGGDPYGQICGGPLVLKDRIKAIEIADRQEQKNG